MNPERGLRSQPGSSGFQWGHPPQHVEIPVAQAFRTKLGTSLGCSPNPPSSAHVVSPGTGLREGGAADTQATQLPGSHLPASNRTPPAVTLELGIPGGSGIRGVKTNRSGAVP